MEKQMTLTLRIGAALVAILFAIMLIGMVYTPHDVQAMNMENRLLPPSAAHWLGTDNFGRDLLSRLMEGARTAFAVGAVSVAIGAAGGLIIGGAAGYFGRWVDELLMRAVDALLAFPGILLALILATLFKPSMFQTMAAIGLFAVPTFARVIRSGFLQFKGADFVKAARGFGAGHGFVIVRHILPQVAPSIIVAASLSFSTAILIEAALSYVGLGVQPPDPSWGRMLSEAQSFSRKAPWFTVAPGIMITLTVLGFNLLGDGIRDLRDRRR